MPNQKAIKTCIFSIKNWRKTGKKHHFLPVFMRKMGVFGSKNG